MCVSHICGSICACTSCIGECMNVSACGCVRMYNLSNTTHTLYFEPPTTASHSSHHIDLHCKKKRSPFHSSLVIYLQE